MDTSSRPPSVSSLPAPPSAVGGRQRSSRHRARRALQPRLAVGASRTKGRELDGQLASAINDVAYGFRTDPYSFGQLVYRLHVTGEKGASPDLQIQGRIEPGCIFLAWDAKFDRGLGRSSLKVGSPEVPHVGIVCEDVKDIKKAKVKIVELAQGRHHVETYKLDDLKHGAVEVRRLP
jgi:hypothetical protein